MLSIAIRIEELQGIIDSLAREINNLDLIIQLDPESPEANLSRNRTEMLLSDLDAIRIEQLVLLAK